MTRWSRWVAGKKNFEECASGCAYHGITDFVTSTLMKAQHVAVSENSPQLLCTLYGDLDLEIRSLSVNRDGICGMDRGYTSLVSTANVL